MEVAVKEPKLLRAYGGGRPHIKRECWGNAWWWTCTGKGWIGRGITPLQAYKKWSVWVQMVAGGNR